MSTPVSCMARSASGACGSASISRAPATAAAASAKWSRRRGRRAAMRCSASSERRTPWRATNSNRRSASSGSTSSCCGERKWTRSRDTLNSALERRERQSRNCANSELACAFAGFQRAHGGAVDGARVAEVFAHPLRGVGQMPVLGERPPARRRSAGCCRGRLCSADSSAGGQKVTGLVAARAARRVGGAARRAIWPSQQTS